jgi:hypothetical protein
MAATQTTCMAAILFASPAQAPASQPHCARPQAIYVVLQPPRSIPNRSTVSTIKLIAT